MSPLLSWLLMLSLFVSALYLAGGFSRALDRFVDRFVNADLDAVHRRERALKVMESWHPSQGPKASHDVKPAECSCVRVPPREYDQTQPPFGYRIPNPSCPVHSEES